MSAKFINVEEIPVTTDDPPTKKTKLQRRWKSSKESLLVEFLLEYIRKGKAIEVGTLSVESTFIFICDSIFC